MSLFGILGEIVKAPVSIVKDIVNLPNNEGEAGTNTGQRGKNISEEFSDIFD